MRRILILTSVFFIVLTLSACQLYTHDYKEDVLEYAMIATTGSDLEILEQYPNLAYVDLRGSTCYDEIINYSASHPDIKVRFSIALGQLHLNQDIEKITLVGKEATYESLLENLKYFRFLNNVHWDQISITKSQFDELVIAYPNINFTYTVSIGNDTYNTDTTVVNIWRLESNDVQDALRSFAFLPKLSYVDLMNTSGESKLSVADAKAFMETYPNITFDYSFKLFGQTVSSTTKTLSFKNTKIGNNGLDQLHNALAVMPDCTSVYLDNCGIADDVMAQFRNEHPNVNIAWRIFVDKYSVMSDAEVILMRNTVTNSEAAPLKYCTNVKYLDMSGCKINDFSFLVNMPNLECVVLQQTYISDLSVLQTCNNLTWLDLTNCTSLKDVTPLSGIKNLKYLNLSATKVKELSPLNTVSLERFKCAKMTFSPSELNEFKAKHPGCLTTSTGNIVGLGWRYNDANQREPFEYYAKMCEIFGY